MFASIFETGAKITTPLGLAGFAFAILYGLYLTLLRGKLLSRLESTQSFHIVNRMIFFVFLLALVAMLPWFLDRARNPETRPQLPASSPSPNPSQPGPATAPPTASSPETRSEDKRIDVGSTQTFFGDDLFISVIATSFEGDPLRHKVTAVVGSPGLPNQKVDRQDVGSVLRYKGKGTFEVRIVAADTFTAEFRVTRLPP